MKKTVLSIITAVLLFGTLAKAEDQFDPEAFRVALDKAFITADVKVWCGSEGQEFTKKMASSLRQTLDVVPNAKNDSALVSQTEKSAQVFEGQCQKAIQKAIESGLSDSEISQLLLKEQK